MINWHSADNYRDLIIVAQEFSKPILLDLYSSKSKGCINLEKNIYSHPEVIALVNLHTLPLRIDIDYPDKNCRAIINNYLDKSSPSVHLLSFHGVTYHEIEGDLTQESFIAQIYIGLEQTNSRKKSYDTDSEYFEKIMNAYPVYSKASRSEALLQPVKNRDETSHSEIVTAALQNQNF
jgi:hypothetical protein